MKWIGTQTIYDHVRLIKGFTVDSVGISTIQTSGESFADNDTSLMTSAAIDDRINTAITAEDLDLTADSGTAAVDLNSQALAVTGGTNVTTSATGQAVTINVDDAFLKNNADDATTGTITSTGLIVDGDKSITPGDGAAIHVDSTTITDSNTSASGTASRYAHVALEGPTLAATNVSVTTTNAATLYLRSAPSAGDNQTITNAYALWVDAGNVRFDGTITSGTWQGTAIASAYLDSDTAHLSGTQTFSGTKTFSNTISGSIDGNAATVTSASGSSDANHALLFTGSGAGATTVLQDAGILYNPSSNLLTVGDLTVNGTSTSIGTVTSGVWEGTAITTTNQKHLMHYEFKGYGTGDGTNYEMNVTLEDNQAPWEHATSIGSDGLTAITVQNQIRSAGQVMPRACTLKKWTGWTTCAGSATTKIGLFKLTPVRNDNSNRSLVLLHEFSYTALGNAKAEDFAETSFTVDSIAAGDILLTGILAASGKSCYFTSTIEVEF